MVSLAVPSGFTTRPATMADAAEVTALVAACELDVHGVVDISEADITGDWRRPSFDLDADSVIVFDGDRMVAYADEFLDRAWVHVHPEATGRGIGTALLAWTEEHARRRGAGQVGQTLSEAQTAARDLLAAHGYTVRWDTWVFQIDLDRDLPPPDLPDDVVLRTLRRPADDRPLYDLIDTAFNDWSDRDPSMGFEDWRASYLDRDDADADLVFVLERDGRLVGSALCVVYGDEGWIYQLAVARDQRGQGFGGALLRAAFRDFRHRGLATAGLSTESRTGARDLYEHVGMHVIRDYARFAKPLR